MKLRVKTTFLAHSPCLLLWHGASQNSCNICPTCGICPLCCYCPNASCITQGIAAPCRMIPSGSQLFSVSVSTHVWACAQPRGVHHILLPAPLQNFMLRPVSKKGLTGMEMAGNVASPRQHELVEVLAEIRAWMPSLQSDMSLDNTKGKGTASKACILLGWGSLSQVCRWCCKLLLHYPC